MLHTMSLRGVALQPEAIPNGIVSIMAGVFIEARPLGIACYRRGRL